MKDDPTVIGVQFHPERSGPPLRDRFFGAFMDDAKAYRERIGHEEMGWIVAPPKPSPPLTPAPPATPAPPPAPAPVKLNPAPPPAPAPTPAPAPAPTPTAVPAATAPRPAPPGPGPSTPAPAPTNSPETAPTPPMSEPQPPVLPHDPQAARSAALEAGYAALRQAGYQVTRLNPDNTMFPKFSVRYNGPRKNIELKDTGEVRWSELDNQRYQQLLLSMTEAGRALLDAPTRDFLQEVDRAEEMLSDRQPHSTLFRVKTGWFAHEPVHLPIEALWHSTGGSLMMVHTCPVSGEERSPKVSDLMYLRCTLNDLQHALDLIHGTRRS